MKSTIPVALLLTLAVAACDTGRPPAESGTPAPAASTDAPVLDQPVEEIPPATAPATAAAPVPGTYQGYGQARFGMSADEVKQHWGGALEGAASEGSNCYYLRPQQADGQGWPALMIEDGKFVRYDVETIADVAPGGGQVGMGADDIKAAYAGRVEEQPHKYVEGGKNLRVRSADGTSTIVFEVDAAGKVTAWHVGVPPQVDYVEGCS